MLIKGNIFWANIATVRLVNPDGQNNSLRDGVVHNSAQIAGILFSTAFILVLYYSHMRYILNKYFSNAL